jgi:type VI secretion system secreted protein Hcp
LKVTVYLTAGLSEGENMNVLIMNMGDDVRGESSLAGYEGKIELLSFSHAVAMQITGDISRSDRTADKPNHQDMAITKYLDVVSPMLNQACCEGKIFPKVEIIVGRNDNGKVTEFMRYTLKSVLISSVSAGGAVGDRPVETLTLNYNHITWKFTAQKSESGFQGVVEGKWDLEKTRRRNS